jgi:hypothetical protein
MATQKTNISQAVNLTEPESISSSWTQFEADLFELQLDVEPSSKLRSAVGHYLYLSNSDDKRCDRVMKVSRFRLLHWMLEQEEQLEEKRRQEHLGKADFRPDVIHIRELATQPDVEVAA